MLDCVMLAAGASTRMGQPGAEAGGFKPLLPYRGSTLVETAVAAALGAGCRVLLVVGCRGGKVAARFSASPWSAARAEARLLVVDNPLWREGMVGSIQAALPFLGSGAFFVSLADMPFVLSAHYEALAAALAEREAAALPEAAIVAGWGGREGHPVLLPSAWAPRVLALPRGERLRPFLEGRPLVLVETDPGALRDIDTPGDYCAAASGAI